MPNNVAKGFIPEIFDANIMRALEDNLVFKKIVRVVPIKAATGKGDTVYFTGLADPTITSYTGTITHEALIDDQIAMLVDKEETFAFKVNDEDALMTNVDLPGSQAQRAAYNLKRKIEVEALQTIAGYASAGTVTATITSANITSSLASIAQYLAEQNVPEDNMFIVVPPWIQLKLKLAGISFSYNEGLSGKGGMAWTKDLGFDVYVTNTVYNSGTAAAPVSSVLAGSYQSIGYTDIQLMTRRNELHNTRAIGIDGGLIYGYKVIKPKELATGVFTFGAESSTL